MDAIREVTLEDMLAAREARSQRMAQAVADTSRSVVSFTMNIPGPVKASSLIRRGFREGCRRLESAFSGENISYKLLHRSEEFTGCEALYAVDGDSDEVKRLCVIVEDCDELSRLFDMDVIAPERKTVSRTELQYAERGCMVCGAAGRGCASRRLHDVAALQAETNRRLVSYFERADEETVAQIAAWSLLAEVNVTPKPGLVDRSNTGSHADMDLPLFERSAAALTSFWGECFALGRETADCPPEETFRKLRPLGLEAEKRMLSATGGVNTHKGAIFLMGTLCGAVGRLWNGGHPFADPDSLLAECGRMTADAMEAEFSCMHEKKGCTAGERLYLKHGLRGARGEAADGFPSVRDTSLPALKAVLAAGCSEEHAAAATLLHLIALGTDTNMYHRGGEKGAVWGAEMARELIQNGRIPTPAEIEELDRKFIERSLSPGGCADLLAVTLFLHRLESPEQ